MQTVSPSEARFRKTASTNQNKKPQRSTRTKRSSSRFEHEEKELNKTYELTNLRNRKDLQPNSKNHLRRTQQLKPKVRRDHSFTFHNPKPKRCPSLSLDSRVSTPPTTKPHTANQTHAHTGHRTPPTTTAPTCPPSPSIGIVSAGGSQSLTHTVTPEVHRQIRRRCLAVAPPPARAVIVACPPSLSNKAIHRCLVVVVLLFSQPPACVESPFLGFSQVTTHLAVAVLAAHVMSPPSSAVSMRLLQLASSSPTPNSFEV
ncbi:hypothetical protein PIB30_038959 [Stylosanthes scabra]|uniref:Uncharacterized protein n=1 Tax=Stylosanthes scabra TaxID=79078 RepID=A0ABU6VC25_9FABA|nr:hypothetical protein [Stylosanthes scabra]